MIRRAQLLYAALLLTSSVPFAFADGIKLSSSVWHAGDLITITGTDLEGTYVKLRRLCFAAVTTSDKLTCFGHWDSDNKVWVNDDDPYLTRWDQSILSFKVPPTLPTNGLLRIILFNDQQSCFGSAGCENLPTEQDVDIGQFSTVPHVDRVLDVATGLSATSIIAGQSYEIDGVLFGKDNGSISFGTQTTAGKNTYVKWQSLDIPDITSWNTQQVFFTPSKSFDISGGLQLSNGTAVSNVLSFGSSVSAEAISGASSSARSSFPTASSIATSSANLFSDVSASHPYVAAIAWAKDHGILQGYPDGTFRPDNVVNRAEFLKIVLSAGKSVTSSQGGTSGFSDVDQSAWFAPFVSYGKAQGIIQGYPDGSFKPNQGVNFAEGLKMAYNALGIQTSDSGGMWYERYMKHATAHHVLFTQDVNLASSMSRKDVVWIVWKLSQQPQ